METVLNGFNYLLYGAKGGKRNRGGQVISRVLLANSKSSRMLGNRTIPKIPIRNYKSTCNS